MCGLSFKFTTYKIWLKKHIDKVLTCVNFSPKTSFFITFWKLKNDKNLFHLVSLYLILNNFANATNKFVSEVFDNEIGD